MKNQLKAFWYSVSEFMVEHPKLTTGFLFIWVALISIYVYNEFHTKPNMATEASYQQYEEAAINLLTKGPRNLQLPENSKIEIENNKVFIFNACSFWGVHAEYIGDVIKITRDENARSRRVVNVMAGVAIGIVAFLCIYILSELIATFVPVVRWEIRRMIETYKEEKVRLENESAETMQDKKSKVDNDE